MAQLIEVIGASGVGKTTFVQALAKAGPFETAYESHSDRPFQALFKEDARYALANQIDYFLLCAEQEKRLRESPRIGLMDSGLDMDFHGFTRLFHSRRLLTDAEFDLCRGAYNLLREFLPRPELLIRLCTDKSTIAGHLARRKRINIARTTDTDLFNSFLDEWLASLPTDQVLELDVSNETLDYERSVNIVLTKLRAVRSNDPER